MYENPDGDLIFCAGDDKVRSVLLLYLVLLPTLACFQTDEDMFRALRTIFPPGGVVDNNPVVMKPPVAVTSALEPEEVAELPDVELTIRSKGVFATTVGPPAKRTLAGWHVTCPEEVVEAFESLLEEIQVV